MKNRFVVDLGNVEISERQQQEIEVAIQQAALGAVAKLDYRGDLIARFPREWLGIWINPGDNLPIDDLEIRKLAGR